MHTKKQHENLSLYKVNMLAVGHGEGQYQMSKNSHAKAEMLTPDDEWYPVEDYPYGVLHYSRPGIVFHMVS